MSTAAGPRPRSMFATRLLLGLWLLLAWSVPAWAQAEALAGRVLVDATGTLAPEQAWARLSTGEGDAYDPRRFYPAGGPRVLWFALDTGTPPPGAPRQLALVYPGLDLAELYLPGELSAPAARAGDSIGVGRWTQPYLHPVLPLPAQGGTVLLKVRNSHPISFPWRIQSAAQFEQQRQWLPLLLGAYLGLVAMVLVLSVVNAASLRDPVHLVYAAYVLALALTQSSLTGVGGYYFWPDSPRWTDLSVVVLSMFSATLAALLVGVVVRPLPWRAASALLWLYGLAGLALAALFATVGRDPAFVLANYHFLLSFPLCLSLLVWYALRRSAAGWWLAAGLAVLLVGSLLQALRNLGVLPLSTATQYGSQIGAALEIPLLLIGLYRRSRERRDAMVREAALDARDPVTGLLNDHFTRRRVAHAQERLRSSPGQACLLRIRVANFDTILREHGPQIAGVAIVHAASCVARVVRDGDTVGRLADGDFVLVLERRLDEEAVRHQAARVVACGLTPTPHLRGESLKFHVAFSLHGHEWADADAVLAALEQMLQRVADAPQRAIRALPSVAQRVAAASQSAALAAE